MIYYSSASFLHFIQYTTHRRPFIRDILFYLGGVILLFASFRDNKVELWESLLFLGVSIVRFASFHTFELMVLGCLVWYVIYVTVVVVGRAINQRWKRQRAAPGESDPENASKSTCFSMRGV